VGLLILSKIHLEDMLIQGFENCKK
jgi:hypothetical protein